MEEQHTKGWPEIPAPYCPCPRCADNLLRRHSDKTYPPLDPAEEE